MTVQTMRHIDRFAGIPLCLMAGLLFRRELPVVVAEPREIMLMKFFGMGSIILLSPCIAALRTRFPRATITFVTFQEHREIVACISGIDKTLFVNPATLWSFLGSVVYLVRTMTNTRYDLVIDFEFFSKFSTLMSACSRATMRIGFALPARWRTWNVTHPVALNRHQHITQTFFDTLRVLGISRSHTARPSLIMTDDEQRALLRKLLLDPGTVLIAVNPNAGPASLLRRWPLARFARTIRLVAQEFPDACFCLIGNTAERPYVNSLAGSFNDIPNRIIDASGDLSTRDLAALLSVSTVLLTNDSGPMHLAAAVGTPSVALFGPESPEFYGSLHPDSVHRTARLPCSPCLNVYNAKVPHCPFDALCMRMITPESVAASMEELLSVHMKEAAA